MTNTVTVRHYWSFLENRITFNEGSSSSNTYGTAVSVIDTDTNTEVFSGTGSTLPNNSTTQNTVEEGTYSGTKTIMEKKKKPAIFLGNELPTATGSPDTKASGIFVHRGDSATNRGSAGCLTINPENWSDFNSLIDHDEEVIVIINRP